MNAVTIVSVPLDEDQAQLLRDLFDTLQRKLGGAITPRSFREDYLPRAIAAGAEAELKRQLLTPPEVRPHE